MSTVFRCVLTLCVSCIASTFESQVQFYLTEKAFNTERESTLDGRKVWSAFSGHRRQQNDDAYTLLFGGVVAHFDGSEAPPPLLEAARAKIAELIAPHAACKYKKGGNNDREDVKIPDFLSSLSFSEEKLYISEDYKVPWEFEIGRYDHSTKKFFDLQKRNVTIGRLLHTSFNCCPDETLACERHNITLSLRGLPFRNRLTGQDPTLTLNQHTWSTEATNATSTATTDSVPERDVETKLRICTYNIWHTNPPPWVQGYQDRWSRYTSRIKLLAHTIVEEDPDIILLQEVRLDTSFVGRPYINGNQIEHLLHELRNAHKVIYKDRAVPLFQVIYQPAMNMHSNMRIVPSAHREEEGLAMLVRCHSKSNNRIEVKHADYSLLPRYFEDKQDDHQRIVQHVTIGMPVMDGVDTFEMDFYNTHLSLSSTAREKAFEYFLQHLESGDDVESRPQILVGDFNAEPHEKAVLSLLAPQFQHDVEIAIDGTATSTFSTSERTTDTYFTDLATSTSTDFDTFPINDAVKRIDYIMARNSSLLHVDASRVNGGVRLIGGIPHELKQYDPTAVKETREADIDNQIKERMKLGVFENAAVTWPSDHYGLVVDVDVFRPSQ